MRNHKLTIVLIGVCCFGWWVAYSAHQKTEVVAKEVALPLDKYLPKQEKTAASQALAKPTPQIFQKASGKPDATKPFAFNRRPASNGADSDPRERYQGLQQSGSVQVNGHNFNVLGVRAVETRLYDSSMGPIQFEDGGKAFIANTDPGWDQLPTHDNDKPVLLNGNGRPEILEGTIRVKFDNVSDAQSLAAQYGYSVEHTDAGSGWVWFRPPTNTPLLGAVDNLTHTGHQVELSIEGNKKGVH